MLLGLFFQPEDIFHDVFALYGELKPSLALLSCLTGKSCSALFTLLLKTALSITLVIFSVCVFSFIPFIVVCFCFKQIARKKLYSQKVQLWLLNVDSGGVSFGYEFIPVLTCSSVFVYIMIPVRNVIPVRVHSGFRTGTKRSYRYEI